MLTVHAHRAAAWRTVLRPERLEPLFVALTLVGIVASAMLERLDVAPALLLAVRLATYAFGGAFAVRAIFEALRERKVEVDLLMMLAALGAAYLGAWNEGAILLFLFALSHLLQGFAMDRTRRAIAALLELRPDTVTVRRDGETLELPVEAVLPGDLLALRPGDRVPLDGVILRGSGSFDEAALTGESMPVQRGVGEPVLAGALNQSGALDVRVTKPAAESTLARMVALVSEAQANKARTQSVLDRFEQWYAGGVIGAVALFVMLGPLLLNRPFAEIFYSGMVLLTVASPCALVISVPAALLSAIANGARRGVLFKGGAHLEQLSAVRVVAFDKTGTLTRGRPVVTDLLPAPGVRAEALLAAVARAETPSEHPIARAVLKYAQPAGVHPDEPEQFEALAGMGVRAVWDGEETLVGSPRLMERFGHAVPADLLAALERLTDEGRGTVLLARRGERWLGLIAVMDQERDEAAAQIRALRAAGIQRVVMLTGDNARVAAAMGRRLGLDEVHAGLLPEEKLRMVRELGRRYGPVAMVGDGVNDAPALAAASVGIAMGAAGTDAALETADIVLMRDRLDELAYAVRLSRRARRVVWQNIGFALAVVVALVASTLTLGLSLPLGVIGHEGSTILVVLNGLRLLRSAA